MIRRSDSGLDNGRGGPGPGRKALRGRSRRSSRLLQASFCVFVFAAIVSLPMIRPSARERPKTDAAPAAEPRPRHADRGVPVLGEHTFVPNNLVADPFVRSMIQNSVGLGEAVELRVPLFVLDDEPVGWLEGDLTFLGLSFTYQHAVKDWLAIWGTFVGAGRLGTNVPSLIANGINATTGFELGWLVHLWGNEKSELGGTLNLWNNGATVINLLEFTQGIIDSGKVTVENQFVNKRNTLRGGGGLRYAYGASDLLGFNLLAETGFGESADPRGTNKWFINGGAAVSINVRERLHVPLGGVLGYYFNSFPDEPGGLTSALQRSYLRFAYTGREDFTVGIDLGFDSTKVRSTGQRISVRTTSISLRYYF